MDVISGCSEVLLSNSTNSTKKTISNERDIKKIKYFVNFIKRYFSNSLENILNDEIFIYKIFYKFFLNYKLLKTKVIIMGKCILWVAIEILLQ
tara:strand:+ start:222 stop:500 length:279 start_codon:yes stop_codon:yes gene_type:complete